MLRFPLICISAVSVFSSGLLTAAQRIDFTVPEPEAPGCVLRVQVMPPVNRQWVPEQEREFLRCVAHRLRLLLRGESEPRLVRQDEQVFLHLYGKYLPQQAQSMAQRLNLSLNRRAQTYFLAVHPNQQELLQRPDILSLISRYELDMSVWLEGDRNSPPPRLPHLPDMSDTAGYMLAEQAGFDASGAIGYTYFIVQSPELARHEGILLTNEDVEQVEINGTEITQSRGSISIRLKPEAAPRMHRLTLPLARGGRQLALVSDGSVLAAAAITEPLTRQFILTASHERDMAYALLPPLPGEVRLTPVSAQGSR